MLVEYSAFVTARDYCYYTSIKPVTTVVNSTHLRISWKDSFNEACDDGKVKNAKLWIRRKRKSYSYDKTAENLPVNFDDKKIEVEADPCLEHDRIKVELEYGPTFRNVISYTTGYNTDSSKACTIFKPEKIYGGLLRKSVFNKTCKKEDGKYLIPDVPKEIKHCVLKTTIDEKSKQLSVTVVTPCYKNSHTVVISLLNDVKCPVPSLLPKEEGEEISSTTIWLIIGVSILIVVIIAIVIVGKVLFKKCQKRKEQTQTDENPAYEGATDYEYDEVETLNNSNKEVSVRKKEVKAEVVDRNSVYGESEEGWEDAIVNDCNDNYES